MRRRSRRRRRRRRRRMRWERKGSWEKKRKGLTRSYKENANSNRPIGPYKAVRYLT